MKYFQCADFEMWSINYKIEFTIKHFVSNNAKLLFMVKMILIKHNSILNLFHYMIDHNYMFSVLLRSCHLSPVFGSI